MINKNEKSLINAIKFFPIFFVIIISSSITVFLYFEKQTELKKEQEYIKAEFIKQNEEEVKKQVENLYTFITRVQKKTEDKLKESIRQKVLEANNIALRIYNENKDTKSKNEIIKMIKDAIVDIRFNDGRGYIFIYTFDYDCILLPINRANEGKSVYNFQDSRGFYLGREIVKSLQDKDEAFLTWHYPKPDNLNEKDFKKIGFNVHFKPYDWFIGSGEYVVDFEENMKREVLEYVSNLQTDENNYFFILDFEKRKVFQKIDNITSRDFQEFNSTLEDNLFDKIYKMTQEQQNGFITYDYKSMIGSENSLKTSYVKGLENWKWIIGKGFYHHNVNALLEQKKKELNDRFDIKILNIIFISMMVTIFLLFVSMYVTKILEKRFSNYKDELDEQISENIKQQNMLSHQSKMAALGEMLGNIAHQWRQPLSLITTASSGLRLQKEMNILDDKIFYESLDNIMNSATYLSKTIDDFRNFLKNDKSETFFSVKDSFEKVFKLISAQFKNHEITIIKEIEDIKIHGLENEFIQALINILNNAKDALIEKNSPRLIMISTQNENNILYIRIIDNGGGIDENIINKVCEPYFTTKHQSKGTGIGLYMTEEIITKHMNGKLSISNKEFTYENDFYTGAEVKIELEVK